LAEKEAHVLDKASGSRDKLLLALFRAF